MPTINVLSKHTSLPVCWTYQFGKKCQQTSSCLRLYFPCFVASVWSLMRSEAGYRLMSMLMIIQRNDHIMNILHNVVWVSLFLWTKEFWQHPNSCTKLLPRINIKSEKGWEHPCQQNGFHMPHVGIGEGWHKSEDSCQILTQGNYLPWVQWTCRWSNTEPRLALSSGHDEIMAKECSHGAASEGNTTRACSDPCSALRRSGPRRTAAAQMEWRAEPVTKVLTQAEWNECFRKHQAWHQAQNSRLCAAVKAVWKGTVENGNQGNKAEILHGLSIILL